jgi:hypothetical protein
VAVAAMGWRLLASESLSLRIAMRWWGPQACMGHEFQTFIGLFF